MFRLDGRIVTLWMHNLITGRKHIDHRDHDGLNNTRGNLRDATDTLNAANSRAQIGGSSPYKGVYWNKARSRWQAYIRVDGRARYLGLFADETAAARAYDAAALQAWGDFAHLNLPEP